MTIPIPVRVVLDESNWRPMRLLALAFAVAVMSAAASGQYARKGLAASGGIWILDTDGRLYEWRDSSAQRDKLSGHIVDIARTPDGSLLVLRKPTANRDDVLIERTPDGQWKKFATVRATQFDQLVGMGLQGDLAAIVSTKAIFLARRGDTAKRITYRPETIGPTDFVTAALTSDSNLYVGRLRALTPHEGLPRLRSPLSDGPMYLPRTSPREGLLRINLRTGRSSFVNKIKSDALDIISDPNDSACVVVSTGMASFILSTDRIVRVCGDGVHELIDDPCKGEISSESCVFGQLAPDVNGFWAITSHGVVRFHDDDRRLEYSWPTAFRIERRSHSTEIPGLLIVRGVPTKPGFKELIIALRN